MGYDPKKKKNPVIQKTPKQTNIKKTKKQQQQQQTKAEKYSGGHIKLYIWQAINL